MSNALPVLSQITIPLPCPAAWDGMSGDEKRRHCSQCDKTVFHLSNMTAAEAEDVLRQHSADLCARIVRDARGEVVTTKPRRLPGGLQKVLRLVASLPLFFLSAVAQMMRSLTFSL